MNTHIKTHRLALLFGFLFGSLVLRASGITDLPQIEDWKQVIDSENILEGKSDSLISGLEKGIGNSLLHKDTLSAIQQMNRLARVQTNRVNFSRAYNEYWRAVLLAQQTGDKASLADSYNGLAILYSLFERREKALEYYKKSLAINKTLIEKGKRMPPYLVENYFALAIHYRYERAPLVASAYLDSCIAVTQNQDYDLKMIQAERAYLLSLKKKYSEAEILLMNMEKSLSEDIPSYMVIFCSLTGEMYQQWGQPANAASYYQKSILAAKKHLSHLNFVPDTYSQLAEVYASQGNHKAANECLKVANYMNNSLYSIKSENSHQLIEIRDQVRLDQEMKDLLIKEQRIAYLEQEDRIWFLKTIILIVTLVFVGFAGLVWGRKMRRNHRLKQRELEQRQLLEDKKNREILSVKNRELTNSTLQIIAKDELLTSVQADLQKINDTQKNNEIKKLIRSIKINKDMSWLAFENRFTSVNSDFFDRLKEQFPHLKPYDLKICALIKLDFSAKEMSRLLGISPESANTSRYRLRKRLNLEKDVNLTSFIDSI